MRHVMVGEVLLEPGRTGDWHALGSVLAAADELAAELDTDQMLRRAVELSRERIGLERVGLYLRDPRSERLILRGTWGTGSDGETVDEHAIHHECDPRDCELLCGLQQSGALWQRHERLLYCGEGSTRNTAFGVGWLVVTPLVAARELVGVMYNDSALSRARLDESKQARAAVFCSLLAGLFLPRRARFNWPRPTGTQRSPWVKGVVRALEEDPRRSGESLARQLSISPGYLARSFKAEMGVSLVEYRNRRLMDRFFCVLTQGQNNLLEAALEAGFGSYTQFHRVYRRMFGQSPRAHLDAGALEPGARPGVAPQ